MGEVMSYANNITTLHIPQFTLEGDALAGLEDMARKLRAFPKAYKAALARTLNRAGQGGRTDMMAAVRKRYTIKQKYISRAIKVTKARPSRPTVRVFVSGPQGIHMSNWEAKQGADGVSAVIKRGNPKSFVRSAFIRPGKNSGKPIVFVREGGAGKIKAVYTTTGLEFLGGKRMVQFFRNGIERRLYKEAEREMRYRLQKLGAM